MPDPSIQYAKTQDGVNIAYWTLGEGDPALVHLPLNFSHAQMEWQLDECRRWYEALARQRTLIRFDTRGNGLSDRDVESGNPLADLEAIADKLGLERFALFGGLYHGPTAIAYAARNPERISHLILWCTAASIREFYHSPQMQSLITLRSGDWEFFTEAAARMVLGWSAGTPAQKYAALARESCDRDMMVRTLEEAGNIDVSRLLARVSCPTLVLHRRQLATISDQPSRDLASRIADARLVVLEGDSGAPYLGDTDAVLRAVGDFLGDTPPPPTPAPSIPSGTAVILFADVVDSTALTERLGDTAFRNKARDLDTALRSIIREAGGTPVEGKLLGDGVLAVFTSARQAIEAALKCGAAGDGASLPLHLGLHAGDVIEEDGNVFGGAVNIAARIAAESAAGEVLVSDTVRSLARTSAGVKFEEAGERDMKGIGEPVRVWRVRES